MKNLDEILVERMDILSEMELLNKRCREFVKAVIKGTESEKEIEAYDLGVKNTMSMLAGLIESHDGETDKLIYQKYGLKNNSGIVFHMRLSDAINELYGGD